MDWQDCSPTSVCEKQIVESRSNYLNGQKFFKELFELHFGSRLVLFVATRDSCFDIRLSINFICKLAAVSLDDHEDSKTGRRQAFECSIHPLSGNV